MYIYINYIYYIYTVYSGQITTKFAWNLRPWDDSPGLLAWRAPQTSIVLSPCRVRRSQALRNDFPAKKTWISEISPWKSVISPWKMGQLILVDPIRTRHGRVLSPMVSVLWRPHDPDIHRAPRARATGHGEVPKDHQRILDFGMWNLYKNIANRYRCTFTKRCWLLKVISDKQPKRVCHCHFMAQLKNKHFKTRTLSRFFFTTNKNTASLSKVCPGLHSWPFGNLWGSLHLLRSRRDAAKPGIQD
jgi:hypothetical protein